MPETAQYQITQNGDKEFPALSPLDMLPPAGKLWGNAGRFQAVAMFNQQLEQLPSAETRFRHLAEKWRSETASLSSITKRTFNPTYLRIIAMGKTVVPILLRDLAARPSGDWLAALSLIEDENPVNPDDAGDMVAMSKAWVEWGRRRGLCE